MQDAFARNIALGMTQVQAAIAAGYSAKNAEKNATKVLVRDGVKAAVERYRKQFHDAGEKLDITPEYVMQQAAEISRKHADSNPSAAVAALRLQADVLGMLGGGQRDLPDAARELMSALGEGLARGNVRRTEALEVEPTETRELGSPEEQDDAE